MKGGVFFIGDTEIERNKDLVLFSYVCNVIFCFLIITVGRLRKKLNGSDTLFYSISCGLCCECFEF